MQLLVDPKLVLDALKKVIDLPELIHSLTLTIEKDSAVLLDVKYFPESKNGKVEIR